MTYWGMPRAHLQIDDRIRPFDLFTPPDGILGYARANRMRAEMKVNASIEDVARVIDHGVPPIALIDPGSRGDLYLHYVTVTGYGRRADGRIDEVVIADPASGTTYAMSADAFVEKWSRLKLAHVAIGLNRVMISAVPDDGRAIVGADGIERRASRIALPRSTLRGRLQSAPARGIASLIAGAAKLAAAARRGLMAN